MTLGLNKGELVGEVVPPFFCVSACIQFGEVDPILVFTSFNHQFWTLVREGGFQGTLLGHFCSQVTVITSRGPKFHLRMYYLVFSLAVGMICVNVVECVECCKCNRLFLRREMRWYESDGVKSGDFSIDYPQG